MPAGRPLPDNPSELIMSEKVPELLQYLSDIFDYIVVDSAPVGLLSDAYVLSAHCDATLYVIRHKHTRKVSVQRLDANNKVNELKNMAIVFNGVKSRGFSKNGYGYGYGYGYIHNEKEIKQRRINRPFLRKGIRTLADRQVLLCRMDEIKKALFSSPV